MTVLHLVRHGHVENPERRIYGRLPGFHLSAEGRRQAGAVARSLAGHSIACIYTSPLERAQETAAFVADAVGAPVVPHDGLLESLLVATWEGLAWRDVRMLRKAEWDTYRRRPLDIDFSPEPLPALAVRVKETLGAIAAAHPEAAVVAVSHGDPIKAGVIALTGGELRHLHREAMPTGARVTLDRDAAGRWRVAERWPPRTIDAASHPP